MTFKKGKLRHQNREIKAIFGDLFSLNGIMNEQAPPFKVSTALVSYNHAVDFIDRHFFISVVSPDKVVISVDNGVTVS